MLHWNLSLYCLIKFIFIVKYFINIFFLEVINSENFFYDIGTFTSTGTYADLFSFNPAKLAVETGKAYKQFEIAPKASTAPGLY